MTPTASKPLTFSALLKGERFRVDPGAAIFTKVAKGICKDAEGQWITIKPQTPVQLVGEEQAS